MLQNINKISHIVNENCTNCIKTDTCIHKTRNKFIKECLPFNNFDETKKNILNFDRTSYIYFYKNNVATYYLKKDFSIKLIKPSSTFIKSAPPLFEDIDILSKEILTCVFNIDDIEIPGYYLFCNNTHIFNIFTTYYGEWIADSNNTIIIDMENLEKLQKEYKKYNNVIKKIKAIYKYNDIESENIKIYKYKNIYELQLKALELNKLNELPLNELPLNELPLNALPLNELPLNALQSKEINKEIIHYKTKKIIDELYTLNKKLKANKQKLKLILEELKKNKEYIKYDNKLKVINKDIKNLTESIENTKFNLSSLLKTINNIFQINNTNNFIKLSYMFNIFNISLLCEKYFDIVKLLLDKKDIIIEDIIEIFKDFSLVNIYYLINYKKNIKQINNDKIFMNNKVKSTNLNNISNDDKNDIYKNIITIEQNMNNITEIDNIDIYYELHQQLKYIHIILNKLEVYIPNYKKIFLMAIITYRNKNNLINNTWGYLNKKYIYDFIKNNTKYVYSESDTLIKYYTPELPILYEYDSVTYKNVNYGNCMENTIFQFLKVLFWNRETKNYDFNKIKEIINDKYINFITNMFTDIYNEKTLIFINKWVEFITEITNDKIYSDYIFDEQIARVEIKPILNNLIIALKYLIKMNDNNDNNITFMSKLITKINKDYKIIIDSEINNDKIELIFNEKIYIIILDHTRHAYFEGILYEDYNNILNDLNESDLDESDLDENDLDESDLDENDLDESDLVENDTIPNFVYKLVNYLCEYQHITFSNMNAYIIYLYICNNNHIFYSYITKINNREKVYLINIFINKFKRLNSVMYYLISKFKNILESENISNICDKIIDNIIFEYNKHFNISKFLINIQKLSNHKDILDTNNISKIGNIITDNISDNYTDILNFSNNIRKIADNKNIIDLLSTDNIYTILNLNIYINTIDKSYLIIKLKNYDLYTKFSNELWLKLIYDYKMIFELINIILEDLSIIDKWSSSEWISLIYIYTDIKYNRDLDSYNILLLSNIEKLLQYKYNSSEEPDEIINNVIFYMTEAEWINIFTNIDFNLYTSFYKGISKNIFSSELYRNWNNDDTWFKYLININNMLSSDDNEELILHIKSTLPLEYIFTKNINWSELNTFLVQLFYYNPDIAYNPDIGYTQIVTYKVYDYFSIDVYNILFIKQAKIIYYLIKSNECSKWSYDIWHLLILSYNMYIPYIIKFNRYLNWNEDIWLIIINNEYLLGMFYNVIIQDNIFKKYSTNFNNKFQQKLKYYKK